MLGACAIAPGAGVSAHDPSDAAFKRALVAASRKRIVLATSDKFGARAPHRIAELKDIDAFVVENDAPQDALDDLTAACCTVLAADRPA